MRFRVKIFIFLAFMLAFCACQNEVSQTKPQNAKTAQTATAATTPAATPSIPKDGNYDARGEVTKINSELGSIELKHENIEGLMPPMQMEFFVRNKELLKGLEIGDQVDFTIEYKHPQEIITRIKKAQ